MRINKRMAVVATSIVTIFTCSVFFVGYGTALASLGY